MCLIKRKNWYQRGFNIKVKPKKAKKDIIVYKILKKDDVTDNYYSPVMNFLYYLCVLYTSEFNVYFNGNCYYDFIKVGQGLHTYITLSKVKSMCINHPFYIFQAIIPKGSLYYLGDNEEIVSNQLIIQKLI